MRNMSGRGKAGLEEHLTFVKDLRTKAQNMTDPGQEVKERSPKKFVKEGSNKNTHSLFKKPKRFDDSRVQTSTKCGIQEPGSQAHFAKMASLRHILT